MKLKIGVMGSATGELSPNSKLAAFALGKAILAACKKETGARVVYDPEPEKLVAKLLEVYRTAHYLKPSCFSEEREGSRVEQARDE